MNNEDTLFLKNSILYGVIELPTNFESIVIIHVLFSKYETDYRKNLPSEKNPSSDVSLLNRISSRMTC